MGVFVGDLVNVGRGVGESVGVGVGVGGGILVTVGFGADVLVGLTPKLSEFTEPPQADRLSKAIPITRVIKCHVFFIIIYLRLSLSFR